MLFPFKCLLQCKLNPKTLSDSPHSYHSVYVSWNRHGWLHQRSVIFMPTLNMSQPSPASTHRSVWPTNPLSILLRAQGPWLSTNWRCALDRLQKMSVTGLGGVAPCRLPPSKAVRHPRGEKSTWLPKIHSPCLGYGTGRVLTANVFFGSDSSPSLPQVQAGYVFERDPHWLKRALIKDVGLGRGLESTITHSFTHQHLFRVYLGSARVKETERGEGIPCSSKAMDLQGSQRRQWQ